MGDAVIAERHRLVYIAAVKRAFHTVKGLVAVKYLVNNALYPVNAASVCVVLFVSVCVKVVSVFRLADLLPHAYGIEQCGSEKLDADDRRQHKRRGLPRLFIVQGFENQRINNNDDKGEHYTSERAQRNGVVVLLEGNVQLLNNQNEQRAGHPRRNYIRRFYLSDTLERIGSHCQNEE